MILLLFVIQSAVILPLTVLATTLVPICREMPPMPATYHFLRCYAPFFLWQYGRWFHVIPFIRYQSAVMLPLTALATALVTICREKVCHFLLGVIFLVI